MSEAFKEYLAQMANDRPGEWQLIGTAPKDGTRFIVWHEGMNQVFAWYRRSGHELILEIDSPGHYPDRPTHWARELPEPTQGGMAPPGDHGRPTK